jgi:hypothetical protein
MSEARIDELLTKLDRTFNRSIEEIDRLRASHTRLLTAAKDLLDTIPVPPTDNGRRAFDALRQAIWDAAP